MKILKKLISYKTLAVSVVLGVILLSGAGLTASAAQKSIPGDALYPLKVNIEKVQQNQAEDERRVELELSLAGKRLEEIERLIQENRLNKVTETAVKFDQHIQQALEAIQRLAQKDPERAAELNRKVTQQLSRYSEAISAIMAGLSDDLKMALFDRSQASGILVKYLSDDASLENINDNQNDNENNNANANENQNSNQNGNENLNANENLNGNGNENENNNDNGNENENDNDNENDNNNGNVNLNSNERSTGTAVISSFKGKVEEIAPDRWIVSKVQFAVNSSTRYEGQIRVGDWVEVKFIQSEGGVRLAVKIERKDSPQLSNQNGNENENSNSNENSSSDDDYGDDDKDDNRNSNKNENEKD